MRSSEAGFTLVELLAGAAIGVFLIWGLVVAADRLVFGAASLNARLVAQSNADRLIERLTSEAASAWAVWAPSSNQIAFFSEDGSHHTYTWSYTFDPATGTVTRSTGEMLGTFSGFTATSEAASDVHNASAPGYDPLFAGATLTDVAYPFALQPGAVGGNGFVALHLTGAGVDRREFLASGTAPTAFTVVVTFTPSPGPAITPTPAPLY